MKTAALGVEEVKKIIFMFPMEKKLEILRELEKNMFRKRLNNLLKKLERVPLSYDDITREVEDVRKQRYSR